MPDPGPLPPAAKPALATVFTKSDGILTKRISLEGDHPVGDVSCCLMIEGQAQRVHVPGAVELAELIATLSPEQAIAFGTTAAERPEIVRVVSRRKLNGGGTGQDTITRTQEHFAYAAGRPAWALIDFDRKGIPAAVANALSAAGGPWPALCGILPPLAAAERVTRASTSSGLYRADTGEVLPDTGGLHIALLVKDGTDIERFLRTLHERCWLAGFGWCRVSISGALLERSIADRLVGGPEHLIFEGGPVVLPPLAQEEAARRPQPHDGEAIDTALICPVLTSQERARYRDRVAAEAGRLELEVIKAKADFVVRQAQRLVARTGIDPKTAAAIVEEQCRGFLLPPIELVFDDPELGCVTVADVLADPERFVDETLADPLEGVGYGRCKAKMLQRTDGTLVVHSFAHGGATYTLCEKPAEAVALSEDRLALEFADHHAGGLRFTVKWGAWQRWTGARWRNDDTFIAFNLARSVCREASLAVNRDPKLARAIASVRTVAAVTKLATADRRIVTEDTDWDSDTWMFNEETEQ